MRIVIQRVKRASVSVEEKVVGSIQKGFLVLIGVGQGDDEATADKYMKKLFAESVKQNVVCEICETCFCLEIVYHHRTELFVFI